MTAPGLVAAKRGGDSNSLRVTSRILPAWMHIFASSFPDPCNSEPGTGVAQCATCLTARPDRPYSIALQSLPQWVQAKPCCLPVRTRSGRNAAYKRGACPECKWCRHVVDHRGPDVPLDVGVDHGMFGRVRTSATEICVRSTRRPAKVVPSGVPDAIPPPRSTCSGSFHSGIAAGAFKLGYQSSIKVWLQEKVQSR